MHPDLAVVRVAGQVYPAPGRPGGPLVVPDLAAAAPAEVPVVDLVTLGEQQLEGGPVQVKADLDVTLDLRRAEVEDEDAGAGPDIDRLALVQRPRRLVTP